MNIVFFRRPKPRQFTYRPVYYDPVKEESEERKKRLGLSGDDDPKERFRANMRQNWKTDAKPASGRDTFVRIFFYAVIALLSIYFIFFTDFIAKFVSVFLR